MKNKNHFRWALTLAGVTAVSKLHQKFNHPLPKISHAERLLELAGNELAIDWLTEEEYEKNWDEKLVPYIDKKRQDGSIDREGYHLAFEFYALESAKATFLIVHGFNEYKEKYRELVYYLLQSGIQVLTYDARGHGKSKLFPNQTQIDIMDFNVYINDLKCLVKKVKELGGEEQPLFIFGHSMGGAVSSRFAQIWPDLVDGLILSSPMLAIRTKGIPMELAHMSASLMQKLGRGEYYLPENSHTENGSHLVFKMPNQLSNSEARGRFFFELNKKLHLYPTKSGSFNWLNASLDAIQTIHQEKEIKKMTFPTLIFRAANDKVVKKEGIFHFYNCLPDSLNYLVPSSEHEILLGHDNQVKKVISQIVHFVNKNA
ncbi:lysophospholipase [Facklamia sp. 7083-14-GEN3]|uniref:lysophospholipase n=1 Tax=Facklamia sp. 7083-14-GEN3 TaxID=2973478 RepID=UPI00215C4F4B|nr:lysophospholipase [Facklamia sp. 7083-14-GEN3]MCR8969241.1 lysophospholipase [Facklamia sp. 7083-14-GEN3]